MVQPSQGISLNPRARVVGNQIREEQERVRKRQANVGRNLMRGEFGVAREAEKREEARMKMER